jgi:hypothetical protein
LEQQGGSGVHFLSPAARTESWSLKVPTRLVATRYMYSAALV